MAAIFPRNSPEAKLEVTFPYSCGGRVAAEFDARVAVGLEDGVLIAGEVELYGYDDDHEGAYEICHDLGLAESVRSFILGNAKETARAFEVLDVSGGFPPSSSPNSSGFFIASSSKNKASLFPAPEKADRNGSRPRSGFENFVQSFGQCHSLLASQKS